MRAEDVIAVRAAGTPAPEHLYRPFLVTSLLLATLVGFVLGVHVPLGRLLDSGDPQRTADLVQAHGQVQILGFAGLFVIGMSLHLMPRFASSPVMLRALAPWMLGLIAGGLTVRAVFLPWFSGYLHAALLIASVVAVLAGAGCFLLMTVSTLVVEARRFDGSSLAFILGALLLFGASGIGVVGVIEALDSGGMRPGYFVNNAILHLEMNGFLVCFILGVALRAIPTMVGVERPGRSSGWLAVAVAASVGALAASLVYVAFVAEAALVRRVAGAAFLVFGLALLTLVWQTGVLRQQANRISTASKTTLWLIRSAIIWMVVAGVAATYYGASALAANELPSPLAFDALRHALGVGVVTMLIAGMSLMILPEFAAERMLPNRQKQLAIALVVLLNLAAAARVVPALAGNSLSLDERNASMALAGTLAEVALLLFTVYFFRLLWRQRGARR